MNEREKIIRLWFDMWLKQQDLGMDKIFTEDVVYTESWCPKYENLKTVKQRLKDYKLTGYMKFLYNKVNWILADGTFFFGQEGSFWTSEHYNKTKLGVLLQQLINNRTNKYH